MDKKIKKRFIERKYSKSLIEKCEEIEKKIENQVNATADIFSGICADFSIQLEYINQDGAYLTFEVFESEQQYIILYFFNYSSDSKYAGIYIRGECSENRIIEIVKKFYELDEESFGKYLQKGGKKYERELKRNVLF